MPEADCEDLTALGLYIILSNVGLETAEKRIAKAPGKESRVHGHFALGGSLPDCGKKRTTFWKAKGGDHTHITAAVQVFSSPSLTKTHDATWSQSS
jgi:hypothetical protein